MNVQQNHIYFADLITFIAATGSGLGWWLGLVPGILAAIASTVGITWYLIQIFDSPWWRGRKQRLYRRRMRRYRAKIRRMRLWGV
jgi:hypothetical protein